MGLVEADLTPARLRREKRAKSNTSVTTDAGAAAPEKSQTTAPRVVTFTSGDGEVFEIPDLPENLGRATALASEKNLGKIWGSEQEAETCQNMFGEKSS